MGSINKISSAYTSLTKSFEFNQLKDKVNTKVSNSFV